MQIKQTVVLAILLQDILNKAPIYVLEKVFACTIDPNPQHLLDSHNMTIFNEYCKKWGVKEEKE